MDIAIYTRKSKFTGKGESIKNQIELCKEYAEKNFANIENIYVYEDEGFTGANTNRPEFQKLIKDIKNKKLQALICYRLDRISRSVADFSNILNMLQKYDVIFVSINEQFDTSTPMGRAMVYIASVFAQLERETIAERIRDNMMQLAKTGRWLGGSTPVGFESKQIVYSEGGKERKKYALSLVPEEAKLVKLIFDKYLELGSLSKVESYLMRNDIKTKSGKTFKAFTVKFILVNPSYTNANQDIYEYFLREGCEICNPKEEFNGSCSVLIYNKSEKKSNVTTPKEKSEWLVALSPHEGFIPTDKWLEVQRLMKINGENSKMPRQATGKFGLLSGVLKCSCGGYMRPTVDYTVNPIDNQPKFYYRCTNKIISRGTKCNVKNINGNKLDKEIILSIKALSQNESDLLKNIEEAKFSINNIKSQSLTERNNINEKIKQNEDAINNLIEKLATSKGNIINKYIENQIEKLDAENNKLKLKLLESENNIHEINAKNLNIDIIKNKFEHFSELIDSQDMEGKRALIKGVVKEIIWDGTNIDVIPHGVN